MNLYLFPQSALQTNGYGIVVSNDYHKLNPNRAESLIAWYTTSKNNDAFVDGDQVIYRSNKFSWFSFFNLLQGKVHPEITTNKLNFLKNRKEDFDLIFCGDTVVYRAIRLLFPDKPLIVRFHNCYSKNLYRKRLLGRSVDLLFHLNLLLNSRLEKKIFNDTNTSKIFISKEDFLFYQLMTGRHDAEVWGVPIRINTEMSISSEKIKRLVWFGGVQRHKNSSIEYFIKNIFMELRKKNVDFEFHLFGHGTEEFDDTHHGIFGHGFYANKDYPYKDDSLYINPDLIGGGVKVKIKTYLENGVRFISTPFGFEGYDLSLIDSKRCYVEDFSNWSRVISALI